MRPLYPIWLVDRDRPGPPGTRLEWHTDSEKPSDSPDEGVLCVHVPDLIDMDIWVLDSDERYDGGSHPATATLSPCSETTDHNKTCLYAGVCRHENDLSCGYVRSDMGWWLVVVLPDGRKIWVHEYDVPVDNLPREIGRFFGRRPPKKLVDMTRATA